MTTTPLTAEHRAELRRLCDEATPGPWKMDNHFHSPWISAGELSNLVYIFKCGTRSDASFVNASRTTIPALLDMLDSEEREQQRLSLRINDLEFDRDSLRAQLATVTKERDDARDMAREAQIHNDRMTALSTVADKTFQLATMVATSNAAERDTAKAQLATATAKLAGYERVVQAAMKWRKFPAGIEKYTDCRNLADAVDALPTPSKGVPDGE